MFGQHSKYLPSKTRICFINPWKAANVSFSRSHLKALPHWNSNTKSLNVYFDIERRKLRNKLVCPDWRGQSYKNRKRKNLVTKRRKSWGFITFSNPTTWHKMFVCQNLFQPQIWLNFKKWNDSKWWWMSKLRPMVKVVQTAEVPIRAFYLRDHAI